MFSSLAILLGAQSLGLVGQALLGPTVPRSKGLEAGPVGPLARTSARPGRQSVATRGSCIV
jgi:hypothetical protein